MSATTRRGALSDDTGAFTLPAIGQRLRVLGDLNERVGRQQSKASEQSAEFRQAGAAMRLILDEEMALQSLALSMQPKTLQDAAVSLGVLFLAVNRLSHIDLGCEIRAGRLENDVGVLERAVAAMASAICHLAGVDPADAGDPALSDLFAYYAPFYARQPVEDEVAA
jgi:hypothetical protein